MLKIACQFFFLLKSIRSVFFYLLIISLNHVSDIAGHIVKFDLCILACQHQKAEELSTRYRYDAAFSGSFL